MKQSKTNLESHEFVVGSGRPCVYLHGVTKGDDEELDVIVLHCNTKASNTAGHAIMKAGEGEKGEVTHSPILKVTAPCRFSPTFTQPFFLSH